MNIQDELRRQKGARLLSHTRSEYKHKPRRKGNLPRGENMTTTPIQQNGTRGMILGLLGVQIKMGNTLWATWMGTYSSRPCREADCLNIRVRNLYSFILRTARLSIFLILAHNIITLLQTAPTIWDCYILTY